MKTSVKTTLQTLLCQTVLPMGGFTLPVTLQVEHKCSEFSSGIKPYLQSGPYGT